MQFHTRDLALRLTIAQVFLFLYSFLLCLCGVEECEGGNEDDEEVEDCGQT